MPRDTIHEATVWNSFSERKGMNEVMNASHQTSQHLTEKTEELQGHLDTLSESPFVNHMKQLMGSIINDK